MKKTIKLNESQLRHIVTESVRRIVESTNGSTIDFIQKYGEGDFGEGTPLYEYLSGISDYDFSVFSMEAEDLGYEVLYDIIRDFYSIRKK